MTFDPVSARSVRGAGGPEQPELLLRDHLEHLGREVQPQRALHDHAGLPVGEGVGPADGHEAHRDVPSARVPAQQAVRALRERLHLRQVRVLVERER